MLAARAPKLRRAVRGAVRAGWAYVVLDGTLIPVDRIADFSGIQGRSLPVSELVDMLTRLAKEKGFGNETFGPIYLIYRVLSGIGTHPTLNILESYLMPGGFIRVAPAAVNGSIADSARITALYATAFLACAVLGDHGCPVPAAAGLRARPVRGLSLGAGDIAHRPAVHPCAF